MTKFNLIVSIIAFSILFASCGEEEKETLLNKEKIGNVKKKLKKTAKEINDGAEDVKEELDD